MQRPQRDASSRLARRGAERIFHAFTTFEASFHAITARARHCFEQRDWHAIQAAAQQRLDLYASVLGRLLVELRALLGPRIATQDLWGAIKSAYATRVAGEPNSELAETFFNSVTRRIFSTVGVNPEIEFASLESALRDTSSSPENYRRYPARRIDAALIRRLLEDHRFAGEYRSLSRDAEQVARRVEEQLGRTFGDVRVDALECLRPVFVRNKGAYLVGRIRRDVHVVPFVLALLHSVDGILVDAVLTSQDEVSIVFSFTRSYFLVESACPRELIVFLKSIMPLKPIAELYTALGFNKHGKTELYRSLMRYLNRYDDRFVIAPGDPGMVMQVFTLPGFDVVFKVIRDSFAPPKDNTRRDVMERYRIVFQHDRVGRLIDAHEFEHLEFSCERFSEDLLQQLLANAAQTVQVSNGAVVIRHLYAERKVTPLNLYLHQVDEPEAQRAVIDYGAAIKELAAANIFPGDFLLKNFGVTRHGRVVFYDYDELCLLEDCRFRRFPRARTPEEELAAEPWFTVGENDIFPEEFRRFLGLAEPLRSTFHRYHGDLFRVEYWTALQEHLRRGELLDVFPYPQSRRLEP